MLIRKRSMPANVRELGLHLKESSKTFRGKVYVFKCPALFTLAQRMSHVEYDFVKSMFLFQKLWASVVGLRPERPRTNIF